MKWLLRGFAAIVVVIVGYGVTANYVPAARTAAICVPVEILAINLGLIPPNRADWGYLKLRSGQAGLKALRNLEQHGATDKIRQTSAAVQMQWLEAGHVTKGGHLTGDIIQETETRFNELRMPLDGKTLEQDILPGKQIPENFWQTQRYRLPCLLPPQKAAIGECVLQMADVTGDDRPEIILDARTVGTWEEYVEPVVGHRLTIYRTDGVEWETAAHLRLCPASQDTAGNGHIRFLSQELNILWVNGHAVNFFDSDCFVRENTVPTSTSGLSQAQAMAPLLVQIGLLPSSKTIPSSLATALSNRSIILSGITKPPMRETLAIPAFQGLPPCFTSHAPKACMAMVADIDHDGSDDVVIIDHEVRQDVSTWQLATLMTMREGHWTVIANHALCAEGQALENLKIELKPAAWRPVEFAGRLYLPDEPTDTCNQHHLSL